MWGDGSRPRRRTGLTDRTIQATSHDLPIARPTCHCIYPQLGTSSLLLLPPPPKTSCPSRAPHSYPPSSPNHHNTPRPLPSGPTTCILPTPRPTHTSTQMLTRQFPLQYLTQAATLTHHTPLPLGPCPPLLPPRQSISSSWSDWSSSSFAMCCLGCYLVETLMVSSESFSEVFSSISPAGSKAEYSGDS